MIEEGQPAATFTLPSDSGEDVSLESFKRKPVVLYFYPRDDTLFTLTQYEAAPTRSSRLPQAKLPEATPHQHVPAMRGRKQMMRQGHTFQT